MGVCDDRRMLKAPYEYHHYRIQVPKVRKERFRKQVDKVLELPEYAGRPCSEVQAAQLGASESRCVHPACSLCGSDICD
jgi:hypothetical protein